jgi:ubiquinone/menaquinone biosynthesis C-methylase UbiE
MNFKNWLETDESQQPRKSVFDYLEIAKLPHNIAKAPNAYQILEEAYKRLQSERNPEAHDVYFNLHRYLDRQQGGKYFDQFFRDVTNGKETYVPQKPFKPILDMSQQKDWMNVRSQYHGNFDKHIKTSIPTFGELQDKKGHAIATAFKDQELDMLDIGGSEGSFARTISYISNGNIRTEVLDPNDAMHDFYHSRGHTPGSKYTKAAFMHGWMNEDGTRTPELNSFTTNKRYDIIHEAMAFQFMSNQRDAQVTEVKNLLKPGGLFLTEQKLKNDNWDANEKFKDEHHKNLYYSDEALKAKEKVVAFAAEKKPEFSQSKDEEEVVGMANNMVHHREYEQTLVKHFALVYQYWDSGNFKGYAASDKPDMVNIFLHALGDVSSKFSNVPLPHRVTTTEAGEIFMPSFQEWVKEHSIKKITHDILPSREKLETMTTHEAKHLYKDKLIHAAHKLGIDLTDRDVSEIIWNAAGLVEPEDEPDIKHYYLHM